MKNYNNYIEKFKIALQKENLKFTEQRVLVLNSLLENDGHYECEDIMKLLSNKGFKVFLHWQDVQLNFLTCSILVNRPCFWPKNVQKPEPF